MRGFWKKIRYRLEFVTVWSIASCIPLLSRRGCVALAKFLGSVAFRLDQRGRAVSLANLAAAFGEKYSARQRTQIARASYQNFARTMVDLFWAPRLTRENVEGYLRVEGEESVHYVAEKGSTVMVTHCAGFEWGSLAGGFRNLPAKILSEAFKNAALGEIFRRLRESSGHELITQEFSMLRLLKHVKRGGRVGMLIDLNVPPTSAATVIDAFGMKMCVTILHAVLAQRAGSQLIPVITEPLHDGTCRIAVYPPVPIAADASVQQIAQACWDQFEPFIREKPEAWMWSYKHWRYQPKEATRAYPFYANQSAKFEKLLRAQNPDAP